MLAMLRKLYRKKLFKRESKSAHATERKADRICYLRPSPFRSQVGIKCLAAATRVRSSMSKLKSIKTVTAAIIVKDGCVLATRRARGQSLAGFWEFPGGKVEPGETLAQCLVRELKEELGLDTSVGEIVAESEYHYDHGAIRLVALRTKILDGTICLTVHDEAKWVPPYRLEELALAPADIPIARVLRELKL